jgi:hypothetical protein
MMGAWAAAMALARARRAPRLGAQVGIWSRMITIMSRSAIEATAMAAAGA